MPAFGWVRVQPELSRYSRVCSYDRAGLGYSELDPALTPRPSALLAEELHTLLLRAQIPGPFILVGHSNGGYLVRSYYERFPSEVAGAVLVDSSSEYMDERFMATLGKNWKAEAASELARAQRLRPVIRFLIWSGVLRWQLGRRAKEHDFGLGPAVVEEAIYLMNQPGWYPASVAELGGVMATCTALRAGKGLGSLPLVVLTAGNFHSNAAPEHLQQEWNRLWVKELQPQLARLSTRGHQVIADSGHMIPFEAPEAVTGAVLEVLAMSPVRR
jgi:pimeloyl-ACP methyl ester carboxylesterase